MRKRDVVFIFSVALIGFCLLLTQVNSVSAHSWQGEMNSLFGTGPDGFTSPYTSPTGGGDGNFTVTFNNDLPADWLTNDGATMRFRAQGKVCRGRFAVTHSYIGTIGVSVHWRMQLNSSTMKRGPFQLCVFSNGNSTGTPYNCYVRCDNSKITILKNGGEEAPSITAISKSLNGWHNYCLGVIVGTDNVAHWKLWVDGALQEFAGANGKHTYNGQTFSFKTASEAFTPINDHAYIGLGELHKQKGWDFSFDWVRWTDEGCVYLTAPTIATHPTNQNSCVGQTATFSVAANGAGNAFQWQKNGANISGAKNPSYTTPTLVAGDNGSTYRCVVTNVMGSVTSNSATLTVNNLPTITAQPNNQMKCAGDTATFSVSADDATGYQWQVDTGSGWADIDGAVSSSYTTPALQAGDNGNQYRCVVSNSCGSVDSDAATLTVNTAPVIMSQPIDQTKCAGDTATFSVLADDATGYQWQVDTGSGWADIDGAVSSSYTTPALQAGDNGNQYRCVVSNSCGSVNSDAATLTVNTAPVITSQPIDQTKCAGDTATFSVSADDATGYQWQVDTGSGWADIDGAVSSSYTTPALQAGDNGNQYRCVVSNSCGSVNSDAATLTVNTAPVITSQPIDQTKCAGDTATFSVSADDATGYQWQVDTGSGWADIDGAVSSSYTTPALQAGDNGNQYRCVVSNSCGSVNSDAATLTVNTAPVITSQPIDQTKCAGDTATFSVSADDATGYQWQVDTGSGWADIDGAVSSSYTTPALQAGDNGNQYRCVVSNSCGSVNSDAATLTVNTAPVITSQPIDQTKCAGDTATFSVSADDATGYQWQVDTGSGWEDIDGAVSSSYTTPALQASDNGNQYRCVVSNSCGSVNSDSATLTVNSAPAITVQPVGDTVYEGTSVTFSVVASGTAPLRYQWRKGGNDIDGADSDSYTIDPVTLTDSGSYDCVVSNDCGSVTSDAVTLTVNPLVTQVIGEAKKNADGSGVVISGKVTAIFAGFFYVQDAGMSGIRVAPAEMPEGLQVGDVVVVSGTLSTNSDAERVITPSYINVTGSTAADPVLLTNKDLGGGDFFYDSNTGAGQKGVVGGVGVNNVGLLVKTSGIVTSVGANYFLIDDGTHVVDFSASNGIRVRCDGLTLPSLGEYVTVIGISSTIKDNGAVYRSIKPRVNGDIQLVSP